MSENTRRIERELFINASPEKVFEAFTEAEQIMRWFAPFVRSAPGVGGFINLSWDKTSFNKDCEILEWEPPRHLLMTWCAGPDGERNLPVALDLTGEDGGTRLRLVHSGFLSDASWDDEYDSHGRGWSYELLSLKYYLEHQYGRARSLVLERIPIGGALPTAWSALLGDSGAFSFTDGGDRGGELRLPDGRRTSAEVMLELAGTDFVAIADVLEGGLFRFALETFSGQPELWVWAFSWRLAEDELKALAGPWFAQVRERLEGCEGLRAR